MNDRPLVVAIPVKDEAERLDACLRALASQDDSHDPTLLVLVNNSTDASVDIARRFAAQSAIRVLVEDVALAEPDANAGGARRTAMHLAAGLAGERGIILTTDADGEVAPDWLSANVRAIRHGADAVAGRAAIDPIEEQLIPLSLRVADAKECRYAALLDEIAARIDPDPADPWPRHDEHSGASIAVTAEAFRRAGGVPRLAVGEDRAFFQRLRRIDARIRHAMDVTVTVSGRIEGRATGGMADTIRRRMVCPDVFLDDRLEHARDAAFRVRLRRRSRTLWANPIRSLGAILALANDLRLPTPLVRERLQSPCFGAAWDDLETASPVLRRRPVPAASVMQEIALAQNILAELMPKAHAEELAMGMPA